jgi:hypothetical protein
MVLLSGFLFACEMSFCGLKITLGPDPHVSQPCGLRNEAAQDGVIQLVRANANPFSRFSQKK